MIQFKLSQGLQDREFKNKNPIKEKIDQMTHILREVQNIKDELDKLIKPGNLPISKNNEKETWAQDVLELLGGPHTKSNKLFDRLLYLHKNFHNLFMPMWDDIDGIGSEWETKIKKMSEDYWSIYSLLSILRDFAQSLIERDWGALEGILDFYYDNFVLFNLQNKLDGNMWERAQN